MSADPDVEKSRLGLNGDLERRLGASTVEAAPE
jgi:hypothetical protein